MGTLKAKTKAKVKVKAKTNRRADIRTTDDLVWALCGFVAGILSATLTNLSIANPSIANPNINPIANQGISLALIIAVIIGIALYLLRARILASISPALFLLCLFFALGFLRMDWREQNTGQHLLLSTIDEITFSARVRNLQGRAGSVRIILDEIDFSQSSNIEQKSQPLPERLPQRISLRYYGYQPLEIGQRITLTARLLAPSPPLLPSSFDFQQYARFAKIDAYGIIKGNIKGAVREIHETGYEHTNEPIWRQEPAFFLARLRASIGERLDISMGSEAPIARALLIGERSSIARAELQRIRDAGLAHILAISGLHLGLFAFGTFILLRRASTLLPNLCQSLAIKKIAATTALIAAFCYMLLAGASVPTQRAFIMSGLVLCAVLCDRSAISLRVVALAALLILALRPESIAQAGFQMSFAAAASLVAFYEVFAKTRHNALLGKLHLQAPFLLLTTTLIASLATAPFVIYHFGRIAQYGLLSNLLVVPILGMLVLPFGALSLLLMPFGLEAGTLKIMGWGIIWIRTIADWVSTLDSSVLLLGKPPPSFLYLSAMGLFVIVFFLRRARLALLGCFLCFCALVAMEKSPPPLAIFGGDSRSLWLRGHNGEYWRFGGWQNSFEYRQWVRYLGSPHLYSASADEISSEGIWLDSEEGLFRCEHNKWRGDYSCRVFARGGVLEISSRRKSKGKGKGKTEHSHITFTCEQREGYRNPRPMNPRSRNPRSSSTGSNASCRSFSYSTTSLTDTGLTDTGLTGADLRAAHAIVLYPKSGYPKGYPSGYPRASGFRIRTAR